LKYVRKGEVVHLLEASSFLPVQVVAFYFIRKGNVGATAPLWLYQIKDCHKGPAASGRGNRAFGEEFF
jgi:hypothetical protein